MSISSNTRIYVIQASFRASDEDLLSFLPPMGLTVSVTGNATIECAGRGCPVTTTPHLCSTTLQAPFSVSSPPTIIECYYFTGGSTIEMHFEIDANEVIGSTLILKVGHGPGASGLAMDLLNCLYATYCENWTSGDSPLISCGMIVDSDLRGL